MEEGRSPFRIVTGKARGTSAICMSRVDWCGTLGSYKLQIYLLLFKLRMKV